MKKRTITAAIALAFFAPFILLAPMSDGLSLVIACQLIAIISSFEVLRMTSLLNKLYVSLPCFIVSVFIPMVTLIVKDEFFSGSAITFFILAFYLFSCAVIDRNSDIKEYSVLFMLLFYIVISISCIVRLYREDYGQYIYLLSFFGAWVTDSGAYIFGKLFGKHKLIPAVSPNKTVEGAIGGIITNVGFFYAYLIVIGEILDISVRPLETAIIAVLVSVVSMLGDLIMSLVKRRYGIKDYGKMFPGHGGMLDRVDSVLAVAPFMLIIFTLFDNFSLLI